MDIAVSQFRSKYRQLPGDSNLFPSNYKADNDGAIEGSINHNGLGATQKINGVNYAAFSVPAETAHFWYHMSLSGAISKQYTTYDFAVGPVPGVNNPAAELGRKGSIILAGTISSNAFEVQAPPAHYWGLCPSQTARAPTATVNSDPCNSHPHFFNPTHAATYASAYAMTPVQALAIDSKMDDGKPWKGDVLGMGAQLGYAPDGSSCTYASATANPNTDYNLSAAKANINGCNIQIKMFSISGR
ncbi:hypothetical protein EI77_03112 [Prosthecobacter fusiformis]|uniref:Uncharacterized protein n=2 Tax=Prosthecobacter fusiformis TaxID=48464 RepID=A0A4R7RXY4_9BACT|nr:hypothetical protein EI77_03112 [Prosthecobacter fusiformis]